MQEVFDLVLNKLLQDQPAEPMQYLSEAFARLAPPAGTAVNPKPLR